MPTRLTTRLKHRLRELPCKSIFSQACENLGSFRRHLSQDISNRLLLFGQRYALARI